MTPELWILVIEAMGVYLLVLWAHSLRRRFGLAHFYALLGAITAVMSWITDAGVAVHLEPFTFLVGSTVFYTALLLGVFVVYVFDGPGATRVAISTVAGVSILVPVIAVILHFQAGLAGQGDIGYVPVPSLRINTASVVATVADLVFLALAWESLGNRKLRVGLGLRAFITLLGVMWLDVVLFNTGAFAGTPDYLSVMGATLVSRAVIAVFAWPLLYAYLVWQNRDPGTAIEQRPVLAILKEVADVRGELNLARQEIERRKRLERERERLIGELRETISRVKQLEGLLPMCAGCSRIRVESAGEPDRWVSLEEYVVEKTSVAFSHGLCSACVERLYPDLADEVLGRSGEDRSHRPDGKNPGRS